MLRARCVVVTPGCDVQAAHHCAAPSLARAKPIPSRNARSSASISVRRSVRMRATASALSPGRAGFRPSPACPHRLRRRRGVDELGYILERLHWRMSIGQKPGHRTLCTVVGPHSGPYGSRPYRRVRCADRTPPAGRTIKAGALPVASWGDLRVLRRTDRCPKVTLIRPCGQLPIRAGYHPLVACCRGSVTAKGESCD